MGNDLSVVNAARVSYQKESIRFEKRDESLLRFLAKQGHTSPYRHAVVSIEAYAPLLVKNQWIKHVVGGQHTDINEIDVNLDPFFAWNESSRRYVTEDEEFLETQDNEWRTKPANSKQGSGSTMDRTHGRVWSELLRKQQQEGLRIYKAALASGVAPEQARLFLPAYGLYVRWRWTTSLQGVIHFLSLRKAHDSQTEIREYAAAVEQVVKAEFPVSIAAFMEEE